MCIRDRLVAQEASRRLDVPFGIVDLSLAPTPAEMCIRDSSSSSPGLHTGSTMALPPFCII